MRRMLLVAMVGVIALSTSGCTLFSWGDGTLGQIGDGTHHSRSEPVAAARNPSWLVLDAGDSHSCAIDVVLALYCWGDGQAGQIGDGAQVSRTVPTKVGISNDWTVVSAGGFGGALPSGDPRTGATCGIRRPGSLYCWGTGPVGTGASTSTTPVQVGVDSDWTIVSTGAFHACGIRAGALYCWGNNDRGQLGDGTVISEPTPVRIGTDSDWNSISASFSAHTCGIRAAGELYCWGANGTGQLGDGTTIDRAVPTRIGTATDWKLVSTGGSGSYDSAGLPADNVYTGHSCGIRRAAFGALYCWGENLVGEVGDGTTTERDTPTRESTNGVWKSLTTGPNLTCGIQTTEGNLFCWGRGDLLGNGTNTSSSVPTQALFNKWSSVSAGRSHVTGLRAGND